ncbi:hypothetical protein K461DRAFT_270964 [Myriangium duriaei CBS 260.36]|uniref:Uncharacterized protein n=1 Tax=Myriangium duriaei CBS 260.36 TaxID=1168546 RepID=A0A9P4IVQ7_9PEZI|nr:hypothetical protein K461DRAFT_270964 [Myriangium duriaei CBS 260.36]
MKSPIPVSLIALVAVLPATNADFTLYAEGIGGNGISGNAWGYQVYDGKAECDHIIDWIWRTSSDVSGGKYGVRCKGDGDSCASSGDPAGIKELEMNFNSAEHHWTLYAARDWGLYDLKDNKVGSCEAIKHPGDQFFCGAGAGRAEGQAKLRCKVDATAEDINKHRP